MDIVWEKIIAVAKRENNSRRSFVLVNALQGKHVPAKPAQALQMFEQLAENLRARYQEPCLAIGFAETATAIGLGVAQGCGYKSMSTTREPLPDVSYLYFSEAHSHATEQKLIRDDLELVQDSVKRIIFVEDEVTTGRTILQIVRLLRAEFGADCFSFTAASLLNGMDEEASQNFAKEQIDCVFLYKTNPACYEQQLAQYDGVGTTHDFRQKTAQLSAEPLVYPGKLELRRLQNPVQIWQQCIGLLHFVQTKISFKKSERVLIVGTEEFMYLALVLGYLLEQEGCQVWCHATTRSPIVPIVQSGYPLQERWQLTSVYDQERITYLYNLEHYDKVMILTDANMEDNVGVDNLVAALQNVGNKAIYGVEWRRT